MSQSSVIAAYLLAAFVLFLAVRNRLGTYASVLWGATTQATPAGGSSNSASGPSNAGSGNDLQKLGKTASTAAEIAAFLG